MTFSISANIQDGGQNSGNSTFLTGTISKVSSTQRVQTLLEITLSLRVFEIMTFSISPKFKMAAKIREIEHLSEALHVTLVPTGFKFFGKSRQ